MAKHVPLGEPTINDHEARIEKLEQRVLAIEYPKTPSSSVVSEATETPRKKKDKDT